MLFCYQNYNDGKKYYDNTGILSGILSKWDD